MGLLICSHYLFSILIRNIIHKIEILVFAFFQCSISRNFLISSKCCIINIWNMRADDRVKSPYLYLILIYPEIAKFTFWFLSLAAAVPNVQVFNLSNNKMCYEYLHDYKCLFNEMKKKMFIYGTWGHLEVVKFVFENTNCTVLQNWKNKCN